MVCKLCGEDRKLIEAHVIPKSFHRLDPHDPTPARLATNVPGRYRQTIPKGVYDRTILCEPCERHFSHWDDYAAILLLQDWPTFAPIMNGPEQLGYTLPTFDYPSLKLFFLSVLWRAAVSSHVMYAKVDLGRREPALKQSILTRDPGSIDHFGVVLQAFDTPDVGLLNPHAERFSGLRYIRFYLSHIIAYIKVDSRPFDDPFKDLALGPERPLVILLKSFLISPERRVMRKLALPR
jgi:hypothetical protein